MYQNIEIIDRAIEKFELDTIIHGEDFLKAKGNIRERLKKLEREKSRFGFKGDMKYSLSFISDSINHEADKEGIIKAALEHSSMNLMVGGASVISLRNGNGIEEFVVGHAEGSDKEFIGKPLDERKRRNLCWMVYSSNEPVIDGNYMGVPINELGDESGGVLGMITFANRFEGSGPFTRVDKNYANHIAKRIGVVKSRYRLYGMVIDRLSAAMEQKDKYTGNHCRDVMHNCIAMGEMYGLDDASKDRLALASLLHDLGKLCVDDSILKKPGSLDKDEWDIIKQHPSLGA
ncbi:HD domain-containing protein, partial [Candidatus Woesearchaeota archaeon]|nr:HD domain-containing protein [Candidatus Woesearchaeota archaeon]